MLKCLIKCKCTDGKRFDIRIKSLFKKKDSFSARWLAYSALEQVVLVSILAFSKHFSKDSALLIFVWSHHAEKKNGDFKNKLSFICWLYNRRLGQKEVSNPKCWVTGLFRLNFFKLQIVKDGPDNEDHWAHQGFYFWSSIQSAQPLSHKHKVDRSCLHICNSYRVSTHRLAKAP